MASIVAMTGPERRREVAGVRPRFAAPDLNHRLTTGSTLTLRPLRHAGQIQNELQEKA
jgi:hypothetical protein